MQIVNKTFSKERSLYAIENAHLDNVNFLQDSDDGESPLKECRNITVDNSFFELRYSCWHDDYIALNNCVFSELCRAPFWYDNYLTLVNTTIKGVKAIRECNDVKISSSNIVSEEFCWRSKNIEVKNTTIEGFYAFFECEDLKLDNINFKGKYSFQYNKNLIINNSYIDTKDAFWHVDGATICDSTIKGEYLGWYAVNLTLIRCKIISHQPLCYCKNLKLIDCEMIDCDFSFEHSDVEATIKGSINSIKNPMSGHIVVDRCDNIILEKTKYPNNCIIEVRK